MVPRGGVDTLKAFLQRYSILTLSLNHFYIPFFAATRRNSSRRNCCGANSLASRGGKSSTNTWSAQKFWITHYTILLNSLPWKYTLFCNTKTTLGHRLRAALRSPSKATPAASMPGVAVRLLLGASKQTMSGVLGMSAFSNSVRSSAADAPGVDRNPNERQPSGILT